MHGKVTRLDSIEAWNETALN